MRSDDVLAWNSPVVVNFLGMQSVIDSFQLNDQEGQPIYQLQAAKGAFMLPAGLVQPGQDYQWKIWTGARSITGSFHTLDVAASARLAAELSKIDGDPALTADERKALAAMIFDRAGLSFDRDRLMVETVDRGSARGMD